MPLRRKNMDGLINEYEQQRQANIDRNKEQLESLQIPSVNTVVQRPPKKRAKVSLLSLISSCEHHESMIHLCLLIS